MFYTDEDYQRKVLGILAGYNLQEIEQELRLEAGYHESVLKDECHAHLVDLGGDFKSPIPSGLSERLSRLYDRYAKKHSMHLPC